MAARRLATFLTFALLLLGPSQAGAQGSTRPSPATRPVGRAPSVVPAARWTPDAIKADPAGFIAYLCRPDVDQALERLGNDPKSRVRAAAHGLAEALIAVKDVVPHEVALLLALRTVNAMAKTAPMTDAGMEAIKKGQYGPIPPSPPTKTAS